MIITATTTTTEAVTDIETMIDIEIGEVTETSLEGFTVSQKKLWLEKKNVVLFLFNKQWQDLTLQKKNVLHVPHWY